MTEPALPPADAPERILVIKLSALGDMVMATGPFAAIRAHHPGAHVTLLTTAPFAPLVEGAGWFDAVWTDGRPRKASAWWALIARLRAARFTRVYDLQTQTRTAWMHHLLAPAWPEWSGTAAFCSHPHANPRRDAMHTLARQAEQLLMAGIAHTPPTDLGHLVADAERFSLPRPFALLVPGGSAGRPQKRWPAVRFAALARALAAQDVTPVILGAGQDEATLAADIAMVAPETVNLVGRTSFADIASLARASAFAIGNDTGPMHLIAGAGAKALVLFGPDSNPALCAPGATGAGRVDVLAVPALADLPVAAVLDARQALLSSPAP